MPKEQKHNIENREKHLNAPLHQVQQITSMVKVINELKITNFA